MHMYHSTPDFGRALRTRRQSDLDQYRRQENLAVLDETRTRSRGTLRARLALRRRLTRPGWTRSGAAEPASRVLAAET